MNDELIEQVELAIYACHFADTVDAQSMMERDWPRRSPLRLMVQREAKAAIAAMQPHIEAQREDAARMALEAAARENLMICLTNCEELTDEAMEALNFAADSIRAIDPVQFRRPADG